MDLVVGPGIRCAIPTSSLFRTRDQLVVNGLLSDDAIIRVHRC